MKIELTKRQVEVLKLLNHKDSICVDWGKAYRIFTSIKPGRYINFNIISNIHQIRISNKMVQLFYENGYLTLKNPTPIQWKISDKGKQYLEAI